MCHLHFPSQDILLSAHVISSKRAASLNSVFPADSVPVALLQSVVLATG